MTDAPETIFVNTDDIEDGCCPVEEDEFGDGRFYSHETATKYRRADLPPTTEQIMADPRVTALVEALRECEAEIDQYIRQEYPADHPVHERYRQRDFGANPARIALAQLKEHKP